MVERAVDFYISKLSEQLNLDISVLESKDLRSESLKAYEGLREIYSQLDNISVTHEKQELEKRAEELRWTLILLNILLIARLAHKLPYFATKEDVDDLVQESIWDIYRQLLNRDRVLNYVLMPIIHYTLKSQSDLSKAKRISTISFPKEQYRLYYQRYRRVVHVVQKLALTGFFEGSDGSTVLDELYYLTYQMTTTQFEALSLPDLESLVQEVLAIKNPANRDDVKRRIEARELAKKRQLYMKLLHPLYLDKGNERDFLLGDEKPEEVLVDEEFDLDQNMYHEAVISYLHEVIFPELEKDLQKSDELGIFENAKKVFLARMYTDQTFADIEEELNLNPGEATKLYKRVLNVCKRYNHKRNIDPDLYNDN